MSATARFIRDHFPLVVLAATLVITPPLIGHAQSAPASSSTSAAMELRSMHDMDHASMGGPSNSVTPVAADSHKHSAGRKAAAPIKAASHMAGTHSGPMLDRNTPTAIATAAAGPARMSGMAPVPMKDGDHAVMSAMDSAPMPGMNMDAMQGARASPDARSPDYSDGVDYGPMKPHMHGNRAVGMLLLDQLETVHRRSGNGQAWEVQGWYGRDEDKLWLRSEGDVSKGNVEDGNVEALWNHAIATYWGGQLGIRHDFGARPGRDWVAFGVQGLSPYWFELEATGYIGSAGRTAARFRADYEVLFTQRLILQPELEFNLYGKDDPARRIGSGLSDVKFGMRLRYEIRREFAPYVGINWVRRTGTTADYARADGQHVFDQQFVAGFRIWF